ncbi:MAG: amidinotransferase [Flavobacteriales bacterium]|nr:amidinotransferase [Flavobacteriales bacterium]
MIDIFVVNETALLESVVLGIAQSPGPVPSPGQAYDPKSKLYIERGEYPMESDMVKEMSEFERVLKKYGVHVYRPVNLPDVNQVFSRDISFVIDDRLVIPNILADRKRELDAIAYISDQIDPAKIIEMPEGTRAEGGDVMPWNEKLFIGYSEKSDFEKYVTARTNRAGVDFLKSQFKNREVHAFELVKSDDDPLKNALHLDCCFQPIGRNQAILYPGGFKNPEDVAFLKNNFGDKNIIEITAREMYMMFSNIFSISPEVIVSEKNFTRLNNELRKRGFTVEEIPYAEISKQEGLLRCSTMPLKRKL